MGLQSIFRNLICGLGLCAMSACATVDMSDIGAMGPLGTPVKAQQTELASGALAALDALEGINALPLETTPLPGQIQAASEHIDSLNMTALIVWKTAEPGTDLTEELTELETVLIKAKRAKTRGVYDAEFAGYVETLTEITNDYGDHVRAHIASATRRAVG